MCVFVANVAFVARGLEIFMSTDYSIQHVKCLKHVLYQQ